MQIRATNLAACRSRLHWVPAGGGGGEWRARGRLSVVHRCCTRLYTLGRGLSILRIGQWAGRRHTPKPSLTAGAKLYMAAGGGRCKGRKSRCGFGSVRFGPHRYSAAAGFRAGDGRGTDGPTAGPAWSSEALFRAAIFRACWAPHRPRGLEAAARAATRGAWAWRGRALIARAAAEPHGFGAATAEPRVHGRGRPAY
jgi:hypothetical protein